MSEENRIAAPVPAPVKEDPETLVLRAKPRPVVRFRRGLVIGTAAAMSVGLVVITWAALEPPTFRVVTDARGSEPQTKGPPDALAAVPASYGEVPQLGPPLPGDLGRPILARQRDLERQAQAGLPDPARPEQERVRAAAEAARQRRLAEQQTARSSALLVSLTNAPREGRPGASESTVPGETTDPDPGPAQRDVSGGLRNVESARIASGSIAPASPYTLVAGTLIPASLITGLNSDLPGLVLAQVTEPVRDSATGRVVLIPQGARLIGRYDARISFGQQRALLVWQRIVLPDGSSVSLDDVPATDLSGYAGITDQVDAHGWRLLKGIALSTLLGVGAELSLGSSEGDLVRAVREATQQNVARAGDQITQRNLAVQPTLRVRPGWPVRAVVHKDLILQRWEGAP